MPGFQPPPRPSPLSPPVGPTRPALQLFGLPGRHHCTQLWTGKGARGSRAQEPQPAHPITFSAILTPTWGLAPPLAPPSPFWTCTLPNFPLLDFMLPPGSHTDPSCISCSPPSSACLWARRGQRVVWPGSRHVWFGEGLGMYGLARVMVWPGSRHVWFGQGLGMYGLARV